MSKLIEELKNQHKTIRILLDKLKKIGISKQEKKQLFDELSELLTIHMKTEDNELYPTLFKKAESSFELKNKLKLFVKDWKTISDYTKNYFDKHLKQEGPDFISDTAIFYVRIKQRMLKEEVALFSEYDTNISINKTKKIKHIVMIKVIDNHNEFSKSFIIRKIKQDLELLPSKIKEILFFEVGLNVSSSKSAFDIVLNSEFDSLETLNNYRIHLEHKKVLDYISKVSEKISVVDYEI